mgnify:CR=1 FL=1
MSELNTKQMLIDYTNSIPKEMVLLRCAMPALDKPEEKSLLEAVVIRVGRKWAFDVAVRLLGEGLSSTEVAMSLKFLDQFMIDDSSTAADIDYYVLNLVATHKAMTKGQCYED